MAAVWPSPALPIEISASTLLAGLVGVVAVVAVALGVPRLTSIVPTHVPVAVNTGVCFILLALAVRGSYLGRRLSMVPAAVVMLIAVLTAMQVVTGRDIGIDRWLLGAPPGASQMSPQTAVAFALLSAAVMTSRTSVGTIVIRVAASVVLLVAMVNLLDVLYGADQPTLMRGYTQMALPTAVSFMGLAIGVGALRPDGSLLELVRQRGSVGTLTRRLMVAVLVIPVTVGWLRLAGERAGWYETASGVALLTLASMVLFSFVVAATARSIQRSEAMRELAEIERERARAEAEAANRAKSEFLSRMSHELRTPLNSVLGFAQLLEGDELTADQRESATYIRRAGRHLLALINEVLDITRIETGSLTISVEAVSMSDCIGEVASLAMPLATARDINLVTEQAQASSAFVLADRQRLHQVLLNLLSNAVKYNRVGGTITVACNEVEGRMRIDVSDTGLGIPASSMSRLFDPFDRLGAETTEIEGTGMGLALSKALVEAMGGEIGVTSAPGRGSTFWIALPTTDTAEQPMPAEMPAAVASDPSEGTHDVLYVEDNPVNLRLVEKIFERIPHAKLVTAIQGRIGLELARETRPHLVLLDLHLPDMDGSEVLRHLRADPLTADVPVVVLSADGSDRRARDLLVEGADAYLSKPLNIGELVSTVERFLAEGRGANGA